MFDPVPNQKTTKGEWIAIVIFAVLTFIALGLWEIANAEEIALDWTFPEVSNLGNPLGTVGEPLDSCWWGLYVALDSIGPYDNSLADGFGWNIGAPATWPVSGTRDFPDGPHWFRLHTSVWRWSETSQRWDWWDSKPAYLRVGPGPPLEDIGIPGAILDLRRRP